MTDTQGSNRKLRFLFWTRLHRHFHLLHFGMRVVLMCFCNESCRAVLRKGGGRLRITSQRYSLCLLARWGDILTGVNPPLQECRRYSDHPLRICVEDSMSS